MTCVDQGSPPHIPVTWNGSAGVAIQSKKSGVTLEHGTLDKHNDPSCSGRQVDS